MKILNPVEFHAAKGELLGRRFPVLAEGYVEFIDAMGSDARIVEAARTTSNVGGKSDKDDTNLIRFLLRHRHGTPFEFPHLAVKVVCPMDTWRQWIRHRTANVNEFSTRYSEVPDRFDKTPADKWRKQATTNRQGSSGDFIDTWSDGWSENDGEVVRVATPTNSLEFQGDGYDAGITPGAFLSQAEREFHERALALYQQRLSLGVAKEQARKDLPLSTYTEAYWQTDLRNLLGFLSLRMDGHAQLEIRSYANIIGQEIVSKLWPTAWQAFLDYDLNAMRLTALDIVVIQRLAQKVNQDQPESIETFLHNQHDNWKGLEKCRERDECLSKLQRLGLVKAT